MKRASKLVAIQGKSPGQLALKWGARGGRRKGAGRPKKPDAGLPHSKRPSLSRHTPVHVTVRVLHGVWSLRSRRCFRIIRHAFHEGRERFGFRLVHYSVQSNHVHLIAEAHNRTALSRGMQGLNIRLAKGLNGLMRRHGPVFRERYHARVCRSPLETRRVLLYVLNNRRRHAAQRGRWLPNGWIDEFSSAPAFHGWAKSPRHEFNRFHDLPPATVAPKSFLLRIGWQRRGRLDVNAVPGRQGFS